MNIVLTICSSNYLAHALALGDSVREHGPDFHFVIGLVDRVPPELDARRCPYEVIPVESLNIPGFWDMAEKYDIVELNTAVKPFYMEHLYRRDAPVKTVTYVDPDILACSSLSPLLEKLSRCNLLLTPHNNTCDDSPANITFEQAALNYGIYNLGFIGTARSDETFRFLKWWQKRLQHLCYYQPGSGFFVDQLWLSLAPHYFSGVSIERDPGWNMAYWNLFERRLSQRDGKFFVNGDHPLVFFHFSSFNVENPVGIVKRNQLHVATFAERPDVKPLFDEYARRVVAREVAVFKTIPYSLRRHLPPEKFFSGRGIKRAMKGTLRSLPSGLQVKLARLAQFTINSFKK
jgi:hypothetical protein